MYITKSIFVNFVESAQLARRAIHDKKGVYKQIMDDKYGSMDGFAIGQAAEEAVLHTLDHLDITTVDKSNLNYRKRHQSYHDQTQKIIDQNPDVIYQPGFVSGDLFCKSDISVKNSEGTYDLREVKAKNSVRKKSKQEPLLDDMCADISFQHYVIQEILGEKYSGKSYLVHLNKEYQKNGPIDYHQLIIKTETTDELMTQDLIERYCTKIRELQNMTKAEVDNQYPYDGQNHLIYFGTPSPTGSIRQIPQIRRKLPDLYTGGKRMIDDIDDGDILDLHNSKGEPTKCSRYVQLRQQGENTILDIQSIKEQINELQFPLYFYDYETVSTPVPIFEGSSPRQQVVVQYSCHKMEKDGTITHTEAIIQPGEQDNTRIIQQLLDDLNHGKDGTYIVRYKGFENSRNKELAELHPERSDALIAINDRTFDLMEVFSKLHYFDKRFGGSSSIKKVLPVLTDISYDDMNVPNGAIAAELLSKIAKGDLKQDQAKHAINDLLTYCKQDTRAMVAIYQKILEMI